MTASAPASEICDTRHTKVVNRCVFWLVGIIITVVCVINGGFYAAYSSEIKQIDTRVRASEMGWSATNAKLDAALESLRRIEAKQDGRTAKP